MASKTALIVDSGNSSWASCVHIVNHLTQAHTISLSEENSLLFHYTNAHLQQALAGDWESTAKLAQGIDRAQPDRVVFTDHRPHPIALLTALNARYENRKRPRLSFHLHGDFLLNAPLWKLAEPLLKRFEVSFFCASPGQQRLFSSFIHHPFEILEVCPYPVDTSLFHADVSLRQKWRRRLEMTETDLMLVYAGRLSLQKNVDLLVEKFASFQKKSSLPLHLFLAGEFDDLGSPLFESPEPLGASFQRLQKIQKRVTLLGPLSAKDLAGLYNAADALVSLSLHHDEDFGMAPAEALCCGCPTLLTSWGGFGGFTSSEPLDCQLVPVTLSPSKGHLLDEASFQKSLLRLAFSEKNSFLFREKRAHDYQSRFGLEAVAKLLTESMKRSPVFFQGWTSLFDEVAERMKDKVPFPEGARLGTLYEKIYSAYMR